MSKHVVMFSSGAGSWAAARRVAGRHGTDNLYLVFADVKGDNTLPHTGEDEDNYRFLREAAADVGGTLVWLKEGRDVWQVFHDDRFLGNSRLANCSKFLKQRPAREWLEANCDPAETTVYVGIDWSEIHRLDGVVRAYVPYHVEAPLCEAPYLEKDDVLGMLRERGIRPPRLYELGFAHANCLHPDTRFITDQGTRTLRECLGKKVRVLGRGGGWRDAEVHSFGEQELWEIRLRRYGDEQVILATPDHLWPVRKAPGRTDYLFRPTGDLAAGSRIAGMYGHVRHNVWPSPVGIAAGFTFGDGDASSYSSGQNPPARAHLCGDKDAALLPYFAACRTTRQPGKVTVHDLPRSWKRYPDLSESQSYLYGWLAGYFAADGTVTKGQVRLSSASRDNLEFVRDLCARIGISANPVRQESRTGYGAEPTPLYTLTLHASTLRADFFVIKEHRRRFESRPESTPRPADWQVVSVVPTGRHEEVMCAVVPDGNVFTLDCNVLTHNCGGFCVRAGHAHFKHLLEVFPERYAYHERQEQELREYLGKDVAILRDRSGGKVTPMTLREFRERVSAKAIKVDEADVGGCGCFVAEDGAPGSQLVS